MARYLDAIIAGFGGQGVMLIGNLLAYSGMQDGLNATYIPVYGPEMRGGTANCTVVLSDEDIGSPIIHRPTSLIIMNRPSLDKFQPRLKDGGVQVINVSLVDRELADGKRTRPVFVPANEIADKLGNVRMANMVALGAYVQATGIVPLSAVVDALPNVISARYAHLIPKNTEAIEAGAVVAGTVAGAA
ncbi:MAG: 2-oxoacid:acceptor oxidoreductase family protein [Desulfovibrionales bacterium]